MSRPRSHRLPIAKIAVCLFMLVGCGGSVATSQGVGGTSADPVVVSSKLEESPAIRACLGRADGYENREELEPHVAADPSDLDHLVAAWMARVRGHPGVILAAASRDGGVTWGRPSALPFNACAGGGANLPVTSDPWVSIGPEGRVYVTAMGWKPGESVDSASVVTVVTSSDGGDTWSGPMAASTGRFPDFMHDNTAVATDPSVPGRAWIATTRMSAGGRPAAVTRTVDGGQTWSPLSSVIPSDRAASAPQLVVVGEVVHVFYGHGADGSRISSVRSEDGGETWSDPAIVHEGRPIDGQATFPGSDIEISVALDIMHPAADPQTGDLYVTFTTADPDDARRPIAWLIASSDGGSSWSSPIQIGEPGEAAWRPTLAVSLSGPAVVTYFRAAPADQRRAGDALTTDVRLRRVEWSDAGELVGRPAVTLDRFDWSPRYTGTHFLGDYHGLVIASGTAVAVFARSVRNGARIVAVRKALSGF